MISSTSVNNKFMILLPYLTALSFAYLLCTMVSKHLVGLYNEFVLSLSSPTKKLHFIFRKPSLCFMKDVATLFASPQD